MHFDLIIISNKTFNHPLLKNFSYQILNEDYFLKDLYHTNNDISFDYLILTNLNTIKNVDVMIDDNKVITNYYFQTNYDHIFAIGNIVNSNLSEEEQLELILEFLA